MPVTFKVSSVAPNPVPKIKCSDGNFLATVRDYQQDCDGVLQGSKVDTASFLPLRNGFVHTAVECYNQHHNLVIRPDDVWLAIVSQFAFFVVGNSERLRHLFVQHQGKKELVVRTGGTLHSVDYGDLANLMATKLRANLQSAADPGVADWILPSFSTTTSNDRIVGSVMLMGTMKNYFSYKFCLMCGVPSVTLEGSPEDWEELCARVEKLPLYGTPCDKWASMLATITKEFSAASRGHVNEDFWSRMCDHHGGGSGPRWLSGWLTAFCVFNEKGEWQGDQRSVTVWGQTVDGLEFPIIDSQDVPSGYVSADVTVDDNGVEHKTRMFAGAMGSQLVDEHTLAPKQAWAICLLKKDPSVQ